MRGGELMNIIEVQNFINVSSVNFFLIEKRTRARITNYSIHEAEIQSIAEEIKGELYSVLGTEKFNFQQTDFDTLLSEEDQLEVCRNGQAAFNAITHFIECEIEDEENHVPFDSRASEPSQFSFYCIKFFNANDPESEPVYLFKRMFKSSRLFRSIKGYFNNNEFNKLDSNIYSFDCFPDVLVRGEEALVLNRNALSNIFDINDFYVATVETLLDTLSNNFVDIDQFRNDCLQSRFMLRKLTRLAQNPEIIEEVLDRDVEDLRGIIDANNLLIEVSDQGQILYGGDPDEMVEIANFLSDAFYRTLILNQRGVRR